MTEDPDGDLSVDVSRRQIMYILLGVVSVIVGIFFSQDFFGAGYGSGGYGEGEYGS